jgi:hypothetical protein
MATIVLISAIACVCLYVIFSMMIVHQLSKRGVKINFFWLRLYIIKYINQYKKITLEETGKVGPLFYPCIISINLALVLTIVYFIIL